MATSKIIALSPTVWTAVAIGTGAVWFTPQTDTVLARVDIAVPTGTAGHVVQRLANLSLMLEDTETLYLRGNGDVVVTAKNAVV